MCILTNKSHNRTKHSGYNNTIMCITRNFQAIPMKKGRSSTRTPMLRQKIFEGREYTRLFQPR